MTHHDAFLADIIAHPEDDAPRLIYADWLEDAERNPGPLQPERAEFIRVQCELAQLIGGECWCIKWGMAVREECRACVLRRRERALIAQYGPGLAFLSGFGYCGWDGLAPGKGNLVVIGGDPTGRMDGSFAVTLCRGFVEQVTCTAADWLRHADALRAAAPIVRVRLTTWPLATEDLQGWPGGDSPPPYSVPYDSDESLLTWLSHRWPGIDFELPPDRDAFGLRRAAASLAPRGRTVYRQSFLATAVCGTCRRPARLPPADPPCPACAEMRRQAALLL